MDADPELSDPPGRCLFCLQSDGGFETREHIFPESMGNTEKIIPPGVVCDRCNIGPLSRVDQALCDFPSVKMMRTLHGIKSKAGNVPDTKFARGVLRNEDGRIIVETSSPKDHTTFRETARDGNHVTLQLQLGGGRLIRPVYASEVARALLKSALESLWVEHGDTMFEPRFDHIRDAVLGVPRSGFLSFLVDGDPDHTSLELLSFFGFDPDDTGRTTVAGTFYGATLFTDSRLTEPVEHLPPSLAHVQRFTVSDFARQKRRPLGASRSHRPTDSAS